MTTAAKRRFIVCDDDSDDDQGSLNPIPTPQPRNLAASSSATFTAVPEERTNCSPGHESKKRGWELIPSPTPALQPKTSASSSSATFSAWLEERAAFSSRQEESAKTRWSSEIDFVNDQPVKSTSDAVPHHPAPGPAPTHGKEIERVDDLEEGEFRSADQIRSGDDSDNGQLGWGEYEGETGSSQFCAICDDGGDLLLCDGPCMRGFHATKEAAAKSSASMCKSLCLDSNQIEEVWTWKCKNCLRNQHQCFVCGNLGLSSGPRKEVYVCDVALCGRFYHLNCLKDWKKKNDREFDSNAVQTSIENVRLGKGEFCCPAHKCKKCGEGEDDSCTNKSRKLAKCRRCPRAYHRTCWPKKISFEEIDGEPIRVWEMGEDLVLYCLRHPIDEELSTPRRNHLRWPATPADNVVDGTNGSTSSKNQSPRKPAGLFWKNFSTDGQDLKQVKPVRGQGIHRSVAPTGRRDDFLRTSAKRNESSALTKKEERLAKEADSVTKKLKAACLPKARVFRNDNSALCPAAEESPIGRKGQEDRLKKYREAASQDITLDKVRGELFHPSCYQPRKRTLLHRGELESILNAIKKAADIIRNGGNPDVAKNLCPKGLFIAGLQNFDAFRAYFNPILRGLRYTSFGRHFTSTEKLNEIVERIHPYVDSGDMVVDFCCGANEFSVILNQKLLSLGKTCAFKNFDIIAPKETFCFTRKDWFTASEADGFLEGNKLIMGLNPPFGVNASLATKFVKHALLFKPKLLLLIVPPETMSKSQDFKNYGYELVWEDKDLLRGKSFYFPGSIDKDQKKNVKQWNNIAPPLYLWSRLDVFQKHRDAAILSNHIDPPLHRGDVSHSFPFPPFCLEETTGGFFTQPSVNFSNLESHFLETGPPSAPPPDLAALHPGHPTLRESSLHGDSHTGGQCYGQGGESAFDQDIPNQDCSTGIPRPAPGRMGAFYSAGTSHQLQGNGSGVFNQRESSGSFMGGTHSPIADPSAAHTRTAYEQSSETTYHARRAGDENPWPKRQKNSPYSAISLEMPGLLALDSPWRPPPDFGSFQQGHNDGAAADTRHRLPSSQWLSQEQPTSEPLPPGVQPPGVHSQGLHSFGPPAFSSDTDHPDFSPRGLSPPGCGPWEPHRPRFFPPHSHPPGPRPSRVNPSGGRAAPPQSCFGGPPGRGTHHSGPNALQTPMDPGHPGRGIIQSGSPVDAPPGFPLSHPGPAFPRPGSPQTHQLGPPRV